MGNSTVARILSNNKESIHTKILEDYRYSDLILSGEKKFKEILDRLIEDHEEKNVKRIVEELKQSKTNQVFDYDEASQIYEKIDSLKGRHFAARFFF